MSQPPAFALPCWADDRNFYVQVPSDKGPVTITYRHDAMTMALPLLRRNLAATPRPVAIPSAIVDSRSQTARNVLRNLGVIG